MTILDIKEKNELIGKDIFVCTEYYKTFAIGNESRNQWIDLKNIEDIIDGDIIQYLEEKEEKTKRDVYFDR